MPSARLVDPSSVAPLQLSEAGAGATVGSAYEAGVEAGRAEAFSEMRSGHEAALQALDDATKAFRCAAAKLSTARAEAVRLGVHDAVALAVEVVEAMVDSLPASLDARRLEEALALAPDDELAVVRLHPDDVDTTISMPVEAKVVADEAVERGGCVVEVGPTRVDAQIGPALARLRALLAGGAS